MGKGGPYGPGHNPRALAETFIAAASLRGRGIRTFLPIPLGAWTLGAGTPPVAATTNIVGVGAIDTDFNGLIWDAGADGSDTVRVVLAMPQDLVPAENESDRDMLLRVLARKHDTTGSASDNADLAFKLAVDWLTPGAAKESLSTDVAGTLGAKHAGEEGFAWYDLDIGAALHTEGKSIYAGDVLQLTLGPNEAVGTALNIDVLATELMLRRDFAARDADYR